YGFPKDLTEGIAGEAGFTIDEQGFQSATEAQRDRSRGGAVGEAAVAGVYKQLKEQLGETKFVGYPHADIELSARDGRWRREHTSTSNYLQAVTTVRAVIQDGELRYEASAGDVE